MFAKLAAFALALPLVSALTIGDTSGWTPGATVTLTWTASTQDPGSFSIELVNTAFNKEYAIANNVVTANGQLTFTIPQVNPGDGYSINLIANNNVNTVYASSGDFAIGTATTSGASSASTASTLSSASMTASSGTSTPTLTTPSATATTPVSSASVATPKSSSSSSSSSPTPSTFTSGAASFKPVGVAPAVALVLSAVAGAVMVF